MHLAFALPSPAETGGGGGADYIAGLADGLRELGVIVEILTGDNPVFPAGSTPIVDGMLLPSLHARSEELSRAGAVALIHHILAAAGRDEPSRARIHAIEQDMLPKMASVVTTSAPVADRLQKPRHHRAPASPRHPRPRSCPARSRRTRHPLRRCADPTQRPRSASPRRGTPPRPALAPRHRRRHAARADPGRRAPHPRRRVGPPRPPDHPHRPIARDARAGLAQRDPLRPRHQLGRLPRRHRRSVATRHPGPHDRWRQRRTHSPPAAGVIFPIDDKASFGKCLRRLLFDDTLRADMAIAARAAGQALPSWADRAREFITILERHA